MGQGGRDPFSVALRLLTFRGRSEEELRVALSGRGFGKEAVDTVLERCRSLGYLDDVRYAHERASALMRSGRSIGWKLLRDLQRKGIARETARRALQEAEDENPPERLLQELLQRRFPDFDAKNADDREKRRVIGFFQRRGFPPRMIYEAISDRE